MHRWDGFKVRAGGKRMTQKMRREDMKAGGTKNRVFKGTWKREGYSSVQLLSFTVN